MSDAWTETLRHLDEGNFTALQDDLGGPEAFDRRISEWFAAGRFDGEPEALAEALSCAMMLGRTETARRLLDNGVDPYAGIKTGLAGPHWAASSGRLETVGMLIEKNISMEVKNIYGGTMLGQAWWSARFEHRDAHAEIVERLIAAGAYVEPGTVEWWLEQEVPSEAAKKRIADALLKVPPEKTA